MAAANPPPRFDANEKTHYVELAYPTLAVVLAFEIGLPIEEVLGWSLIGYMLLGFGALPAGFLADRFGSRIMVTTGLLVSGFAMLAASFVEPGWPIVVCLAFVGLGASTYHPAGMGLISRAISARGTALGINGIYGNAGIALGPAVTGFLATSIGSRATFAVTGVGILVVALGTGALRFEEPPPSTPEDSANPGGPVPRLLIMSFALLCVAALLGGFNYRANSIAQPALFSERIEFLSYGLATSLAMCAGIGGQYLGGRIADRFPLMTSYLIFHAASLPAVLLIPYSSEYALFAVAALFAFFSLGMQPIENSLYAQLTPDRWRSTAYGLKFTLTFGIGASAVAMVEWIAPSEGFVGVYHVLALFVGGIIAAAFTLAFLHRGRNAQAQSVVIAGGSD
ncbi:MAG: MFS transporter [Deltaproteobacteria bacterium]|nr:MFS transporter [Deltaproteobacteria bacterium]